jgi:uncharacterized circularly permuted ATP-grasp superfamily protein
MGSDRPQRSWPGARDDGPDHRATSEGAFDEQHDAGGAQRPGYARVLGALKGIDLVDLCRSIEQHLQQRGVSFGTEPFVVDPIPRLIAAAEWESRAAGLAQRTRALNAFLLDAYSERRIVAVGVIAAEVIDDAEGCEPDLRGRLPGHRFPAAVIGFDIVRSPGGEFLVLEDNLRTPSGFAYGLAAREALMDSLPAGLPQPRPIDPVTYELLAATLRAAAPPGRGDHPTVIVLTDGSGNVAYHEHAQAARRLDVARSSAPPLRSRTPSRLGAGSPRSARWPAPRSRSTPRAPPDPRSATGRRGRGGCTWSCG